MHLCGGRLGQGRAREGVQPVAVRAGVCGAMMGFERKSRHAAPQFLPLRPCSSVPLDLAGFPCRYMDTCALQWRPCKTPHMPVHNAQLHPAERTMPDGPSTALSSSGALRIEAAHDGRER